MKWGTFHSPSHLFLIYILHFSFLFGMYVHVYVCTYTCTCICMYMYMYVHVHVHVYVCTCICMYIWFICFSSLLLINFISSVYICFSFISLCAYALAVIFMPCSCINVAAVHL